MPPQISTNTRLVRATKSQSRSTAYSITDAATRVTGVPIRINRPTVIKVAASADCCETNDNDKPAARNMLLVATPTRKMRRMIPSSRASSVRHMLPTSPYSHDDGDDQHHRRHHQFQRPV